MFKKLLNVVEQRSSVEEILQKKRNRFDEENAILIAQLEDLKEKEVLLREEALLSLEKDNLNSKTEGDKVIYRQVRITKTVSDPAKLRDDIMARWEQLEGMGIKPTEAKIFTEEVVVADKKAVMEIADIYSKVEGKELDGINIKETKFVAIKNLTQ